MDSILHSESLSLTRLYLHRFHSRHALPTPLSLRPPPILSFIHRHHRLWFSQNFNEVQKLLNKTNGQVVGNLMAPAPVIVRETTNLKDAARSVSSQEMS